MSDLIKPLSFDVPCSTMSLEEVAKSLSDEKIPDTYRPSGKDALGSFEFNAQALDQFVIWRGSSDVERKMTVQMRADDYLFFFDQGNGHRVTLGKNEHVVRGDIALLTSGHRYNGIVIEAGSVGEGFYISQDIVHKALIESIEGPVPPSFEFTSSLNLADDCTASLLGLVHAFHLLYANPQIVVPPIALSRFEDMFCTLMIRNLRHSLTQRLSRQHYLIKPVTVKRAVDYAHAFADKPITTADLAAAAGVSSRTLQVNFQKFLGMSPIQYLKNVRMDGVRRELIQSCPDTNSVTTIARRWGFVHMGRFAADYRQRFGVNPTVDLRRNR